MKIKGLLKKMPNNNDLPNKTPSGAPDNNPRNTGSQKPSLPVQRSGEGKVSSYRESYRNQNTLQLNEPTLVPDEETTKATHDSIKATAPETDRRSSLNPNLQNVPPRKPSSKRERVSRGPDETPDISFMHPSEQEFAKILDFYHIPYLYEPRSFPLRWQGERVVEMFTPDFYLPVQDQYIELTTMKQSLVTQKNRKLRRVRESYPEINVLLLYRRDIVRLLAKYDSGPLGEAETYWIERILYSSDEIHQRVKEIGSRITRDYAGKTPILVGVLQGVISFLADLARQIDLPVRMDFIEIARYGARENHEGHAVKVTRDTALPIEGEHVILIEDIVDTGMTVQFLIDHLRSKNPASLTVCTLLDKLVRRMNAISIDYGGFEVPDEFLVGYGLDYNGLYRNLPDISILKATESKTALTI